MNDNDIKIERTAGGKWRVLVETPNGFQVVGEYPSEAEAKQAAAKARSRGFSATAEQMSRAIYEASSGSR